MHYVNIYIPIKKKYARNCKNRTIVRILSKGENYETFLVFL